ncbi:hypothetical protein EV363DRAFT_1315845, partial [Boletus edulis]
GLVNDAVQPLTFCTAHEDGLFALANFVESQSYVRNNEEGGLGVVFCERRRRGMKRWSHLSRRVPGSHSVAK